MLGNLSRSAQERENKSKLKHPNAEAESHMNFIELQTRRPPPASYVLEVVSCELILPTTFRWTLYGQCRKLRASRPWLDLISSYLLDCCFDQLLDSYYDNHSHCSNYTSLSRTEERSRKRNSFRQGQGEVRFASVSVRKVRDVAALPACGPELRRCCEQVKDRDAGRMPATLPLEMVL